MSRAKAIWLCVLVGGLASVALALSLISDPTRFFRSYLFGYLYWLNLGLGALPLLMIYHLTGGAWGERTQKILESSLRTFPWLAILFLPIALGAGKIYAWAAPMDGVHANFQHAYLNRPFFFARSLFVMASWGILAWGIVKPGDPARRRMWSAAGLVTYLLTATVAAIDWQMSLEPMHRSTIYGLVTILDQGLQGWAFALVAFAWFGTGSPPRDPSVPEDVLRDMGNLLLTLIVLWAYLSFMEYLVVWSANLPSEVLWFQHRTHGGWQVPGILLAALQFGAPFSVLLLRASKARPRRIAWIAMILLATGVVECHWRVMPAFHPDGLKIQWTDLVAWVAIGGLWLALFLKKLGPEELAHA